MVTSAFAPTMTASSTMPSNRNIYNDPMEASPSSSQHYGENTNPCPQTQRESREGSKRAGLGRRSNTGRSGKPTGGKEKTSGILSSYTNSSDEEPSPHSSIFEAPLVSDEELDIAKEYKGGETIFADDGYPEADRGRMGRDTTESAKNERRSRSRRERGKLETIVERNSAGSLTAISISRRNSADAAFEADRTFEDEEEWSSLLPRDKRRRISKSLGDNTDTEDEYGDGCLSQVYDYASPIMPAHLVYTPSMNTPTIPTEVPSPMLTPPLSVSYFNRNYGSSSPVRSSSLLAFGPTFRPPVSGYRSYGTLSSHPFHHAPFAQSVSFNNARVDSSGDGAGENGRVTPDSLGSDSDSVSTGLISRNRSRVSTIGSYEGMGWRFWMGTFCCCLRGWGRGSDVGD